MGFHWHLAPCIAARKIDWDELSGRLGFPVPKDLRGVTPPMDLSLSVVADLCQAIGCQPADLLTFTSDSLAEQAERQLSANQTYQSFLAFNDPKQDKKIT